MKTKRLMGRMVQVVLRIPVEADAEVQRIAKKECRSYSSVARQAIVEWLENRKKGGKK
jgi:predicted transcriptional regulator